MATFTVGSAPLLIARVAHFPAATIGFDLARGVSLGDAVAAISENRGKASTCQRRSALKLPRCDRYVPCVADQRSVADRRGDRRVYIVLGVLYESFIHPLTILSTLPSAGVGALLALLVTGHDLGVIAIIGIVLLIGIVKKNAIMMIDFAIDSQRTQAMTPADAISQAALLRFRPIMMTTFAALFATLPLIFGTGMGAELRRPLGLAIAGGLIVSQALTLFTTPVIYPRIRAISPRSCAAGARRDVERCSCRSHREPFRPIDPQADRHAAADDRRRADRHRGILRCCRSRRCRKSDIPTISVQAKVPGASPDDHGHQRRRTARANTSARSPASPK